MSSTRRTACCIAHFFLDIRCDPPYKGDTSACSYEYAYFDVKGESIDEIRNQEKGSPEKESYDQEEEVVAEGLAESEIDQPASSDRGRFYFWPSLIFRPALFWVEIFFEALLVAQTFCSHHPSLRLPSLRTTRRFPSNFHRVELENGAGARRSFLRRAPKSGGFNRSPAQGVRLA
jgi:hypothetical protein